MKVWFFFLQKWCKREKRGSRTEGKKHNRLKQQVKHGKKNQSAKRDIPEGKRERTAGKVRTQKEQFDSKFLEQKEGTSLPSDVGEKQKKKKEKKKKKKKKKGSHNTSTFSRGGR